MLAEIALHHLLVELVVDLGLIALPLPRMERRHVQRALREQVLELLGGDQRGAGRQRRARGPVRPQFDAAIASFRCAIVTFRCRRSRCEAKHTRQDGPPGVARAQARQAQERGPPTQLHINH
jgi:hypothetical protein